MNKIANIAVSAILAFNCSVGLKPINSILPFELVEPYTGSPPPKMVKDEPTYITVYALRPCWLFKTPTFESEILQTYNIGDAVNVYAELIGDNNLRYFVTDNGYLAHMDFTYDKDNVFYPEESIKYAKENAEIVNIPNDYGDVVRTLSLNEEIKLSGYNHNNYYKLSDHEGEYIHIDEFMDEPKEILVPMTPYIEDTTPIINIYTPTGSGQLTPSAGVFYGPSGKETYYNLPMGGVISIAQAAGIQGDYWERADGAKMYGNYIICACGFDVRPRGTIVETSLGTGICLDTGTFAYTDPYQIDLAVTWN